MARRVHCLYCKQWIRFDTQIQRWVESMKNEPDCVLSPDARHRILPE